MTRGSKLDEIMTLVFMILAIGAIVCYFVLAKGNPTYFVLGGAAIVLRIVQYIMRRF